MSRLKREVICGFSTFSILSNYEGGSSLPREALLATEILIAGVKNEVRASLVRGGVS